MYFPYEKQEPKLVFVGSEAEDRFYDNPVMNAPRSFVYKRQIVTAQSIVFKKSEVSDMKVAFQKHVDSLELKPDEFIVPYTMVDSYETVNFRYGIAYSDKWEVLCKSDQDHLEGRNCS